MAFYSYVMLNQAHMETEAILDPVREPHVREAPSPTTGHLCLLPRANNNPPRSSSTWVCLFKRWRATCRICTWFCLETHRPVRLQTYDCGPVGQPDMFRVYTREGFVFLTKTAWCIKNNNDWTDVRHNKYRAKCQVNVTSGQPLCCANERGRSEHAWSKASRRKTRTGSHRYRSLLANLKRGTWWTTWQPAGIAFPFLLALCPLYTLLK